LNPQPSTLNPQPSTLNPQPSTLNPQPSTLNPRPSTLNPQPSTLHQAVPLGVTGFAAAVFWLIFSTMMWMCEVPSAPETRLIGSRRYSGLQQVHGDEGREVRKEVSGDPKP
ncbi:hypothetical protein T484DRAFT_1609756, partial [Baffinella frigidus]